jgi:hypothetical protein
MKLAVPTLMRPIWNNEISASIKNRLAELLAAPPTDSPFDVGSIAREMQALPVSMDVGGGLAFTADGRVLSLDWQTGQVKPTNDESAITRAAVAASEKYPELRELLPDKPPTATTCCICKGTGKVVLTPDVTCGCGTCWGLGWVETT